METETAPKILVVDDNPGGRYATCRVLRAAGFSVLEAGSGAQGIEQASDADLVVLDVNLPDMSGFEVCRRMRGNLTTSRTPVIHLSASFVKDADKVKGLEAGADGYLTHPVEPPVLIATINAFLRARRAEEQMRQSEAKFKAIFDQAPLGILLVSKELLYLEANPAMCRILGRSREQIVGRHNSSFVPAGLEAQTLKIAAAVEEQGGWHGIFPLLHADGRPIELEWSIARYSFPGVRLAIVNDITERRVHEAERERLLGAERAAREEAERANRLKDEFLATLSHELRTPLNAIVGWSQLLKSGHTSPEDLSEGIDAIERNAQSQAQLIADLLDVSRIISGKLRLEVHAFDLVGVVRAALETVAPALKAKQISLEEAFDPNVGLLVGDPDRIQQVIWNLLSNAVKFTYKGGRVRVSLERLESHVRLQVSDNGKGIRSDFLPHIFERFRQENASTTRNEGGLGLGLAIVKHLIEMHGGAIFAQSAGEKMGSTFTATLPIAVVHGQMSVDAAPAAHSARGQRSSGGSTPRVRLDGVRIMIVEDDPDARSLLRRVLADQGAVVGDAEAVPAALELLPNFKPRLLISDVGIPKQDGYDLIRAVRALGYSAATLPAVALTAFARNEDRVRSLAAGFQLHLAKPVDADELLKAISALVGDRELAN